LLPAIEDSKVNHDEYYDKYNDNHNSYSFSYSTHTHDVPFFENLDHLLDNLGTGEFSFEIYYYVIGKKSNNQLNDVYNFDPFNRNKLIKLSFCSYGYCKLHKITFKLFMGNSPFQFLNISQEIGKLIYLHKRVCQLSIVLDKEIVLVITKIKSCHPYFVWIFFIIFSFM
jgi:hypothetical protein